MKIQRHISSVSFFNDHAGPWVSTFYHKTTKMPQTVSWLPDSEWTMDWLSLQMTCFHVVAATSAWTLLHWEIEKLCAESENSVVKGNFFCTITFRGADWWWWDDRELNGISDWKLDMFCKRIFWVVINNLNAACHVCPVSKMISSATYLLLLFPIVGSL